MSTYCVLHRHGILGNALAADLGVRFWQHDIKADGVHILWPGEAAVHVCQGLPFCG